MKVTILGSAAAEAIPNPFCKCAVCETARQQGGPHVRARAAALINDDLLIDFGPDLMSSAGKLNLYMGDVHTMLLTHMHSDHWLPDNLTWRGPVFAPGLETVMDIFGPADGMAMVEEEEVEKNKVTLNTITGGMRWKRPGYTVTAIPASHGDGKLEAVIYSIDDGTSRLLYATDTGPLSDAAWEVLQAQAPFDVILLDDTFTANGEGPSHHGNGQFLKTRETLLSKGLLAPGGRMFAHHFSHNGGMTHDDLIAFFAPYDVDVTYDGLVITL